MARQPSIKKETVVVDDSIKALLDEYEERQIKRSNFTLAAAVLIGANLDIRIAWMFLERAGISQRPLGVGEFNAMIREGREKGLV